MPRVKFPVVAPLYQASQNGAFEIPVLREVCRKMEWTLRLFVDPSLQPHQIWYPMLDDGDADIDACKKLFRALSEEWPRLFPIMSRVPRAEDSDMHPALDGLGSNQYYGGWNRRFDFTAFLQGPLWVGMSVSCRSSCKVLGPSVLYSRVTVGTAAIVNRSVIGRGSEVDAGAQVADSIIGRDVYIGPTALLLHKTLNNAPVRLNEGMSILNRKKCGVIVGNHCRIGAGARIEPGTVLMPGCVVPVGRHVKSGFYCPEDFH